MNEHDIIQQARTVARLHSYLSRIEKALYETQKLHRTPNLLMISLNLTKEQLEGSEDYLLKERDRTLHELAKEFKNG